jgi:putative transposase
MFFHSEIPHIIKLATIAEESVYHENIATKLEARQAIFKYIEFFYNRKRRHSNTGCKAPFVYEEMNAAA